MKNVSCQVEDFRDEGDSYIEVKVTAQNLPEEVGIGLAKWAVSMELGIDLDEIGAGTAADLELGGWFVTFELS